jgi:DNA-binding NarL/FixJ family response regulator
MNSHPGRTKPKPEDALSLSERQEQVARCVATGLKNREIADTLLIGEQTVKHHLKRIFHKAGVKNRFEVALWMVSQYQALVTEPSSSMTGKFRVEA